MSEGEDHKMLDDRQDLWKNQKL